MFPQPTYIKKENKLFKKLRDNRRGIIGLIAGLVIAMVVVGVILMVGLQVSASFQTTSATTNYGSAANNATAALVFTNTFAGYNLMALHVLGVFRVQKIPIRYSCWRDHQRGSRRVPIWLRSKQRSDVVKPLRSFFLRQGYHLLF